MLCLTRDAPPKPLVHCNLPPPTATQRVRIITSDGPLWITVRWAGEGKVSLGFEAPKECLIHREEIIDAPPVLNPKERPMRQTHPQIPVDQLDFAIAFKRSESAGGPTVVLGTDADGTPCALVCAAGPCVGRLMRLIDRAWPHLTEGPVMSRTGP